MNGTSTVATITVIILITKFHLNKFWILTCPIPFIVLLDLVITSMGLNSFVF